jgi:hypothetical protein
VSRKEGTTLKIRMKIAVAGTFEGIIDGVEVGDIVEVPDVRGAHYCDMHYAEPVAERKEERAVAPKGEEREEEPPKRGPGRPTAQKP